MQKVLQLVILASLFLAVVSTKEISKDETTVSSINSNNSTSNDDDSNKDTDEETESETDTDEDNTGIERIECLDAFERFMLKTTSFQSQLITKASARFNGKSFCVSGMSTVLSLSSLFLNSEGPTLREISDSIGIDKDEGRCVFKTVVDYMSSVLAGTYIPGSVIFASDEYPFTDNLISDVNTYSAGGVLTLDIMKNPSLAGDMVNEAISTQTKGELSNVITTFNLPEIDTKISLAMGNLLSLRWLYQFESELQKKRTFNVSPSLRKKIVYMKQVAPYKFLDDSELLDAKVVEIPLEGNDLALLVVLPNGKYNYAEISRQIENPDVYNSVINSMKEHLVKIEIPQNMNFTTYLNILSFMEETRFANTILNENTLDLKGAIVGDKKAAVTYAIEKSSIFTTTEGGLIPYKKKLRKASFKADHPFIFYLRCLSLRGLVLLGGAVVNPADTTITM